MKIILKPFYVFIKIISISVIFNTILLAQEPDTLWTRTFGDSGLYVGNSVQQTTDGGYIVAGGKNGEVLLIKTDASGDTLWTKTFGGGEGNSVQQTTDGGYIVAGEKNRDVLLIKTDVSGDTLWTKTFDRGDSERGHSVQQTADGGYIVTGYTRICIDISCLYRVWLIKTDASGDSLWTKTFGGDWIEHMTGTEGRPLRSSVQQTTDGGYIVAGSFFDELLIKTDASGDTLWTKTMIFDVTDCSVQQTADGGYIVAGTNVAGTDDWEVFLIKIAPDLTNIQKKRNQISYSLFSLPKLPQPLQPINYHRIHFTQI